MPKKHSLYLCLFLSMLAGCSRPSAPISQPDVSLTANRFRPIHLEPYWPYDLELSAGEQIQKVCLAPKSIYLLSNLNKLYRMDRDDGVVTWIDQPAEPPRLVFQPAEHGDQTLVVAHNTVRIYDRRSGQFIKQFDLGFTANSDPAFDGENVYVADSKDRVVALELRNGIKLWTCRAAKAISAQPVVQDRLLVSASESGEVLAYNTLTGMPAWPDYFRTRDALLAKPVLTPNACYIAGTDSIFYCLAINNGQELWRYFAGQTLNTAPVVTDGRVFLPVPGKGLVVLDADSGSESEGFHFPDGKKYIGRIGDRFYILAEGGRIISADARTGRRLGQINVQDFDFFLADDTDSRIYLANTNGRVVCLHQLGAGFFQFQPANSQAD